ncbi:MAG: class I SAM-dependent methyltransferase [Chloroflexi bacterium]|nr:class I SAM-dependent methyltransferase [Chloroflexota bacterium]
MVAPTPHRDRSRTWQPAPEQLLYQSYSVEEDRIRTNVHYEQPPEFFYTLTGGEWNVYSCNLWMTGARNDTESQEAKLDLMARIMDLQPGQRLLDVGCGWAGPLTYFSKRYGVRGVGLTLSPTQKRCADERIARYGADVQVIEKHWKDYQPTEPFDAIFTDEVIVHFHDLEEFFRQAWDWLRPGGVFLNKEVHFTNSRHGATMQRGDVLIHEIYGLTGNYRTIAEELSFLDRVGFQLKRIVQIPLENYLKTARRWEENLLAGRKELEALVGPEYFHRFRAYLQLTRKILRSGKITLDAIASTKMDLPGFGAAPAQQPVYEGLT